ncbi:MAG: glycoside hydrolase family 3 protein, partial [Bacteroidota bacterium]
MVYKSIFLQISFLFGLTFLFSCQSSQGDGQIEISIRQRRQLERTNDEVLEAKVDSLLNEMTLAEKVGQMTQLNNNVYAQEFKASASESAPPEIQVSIDTNKLIPLIRDYHIGSFLNGIGVSPEIWYEYGKELQELNFRYSRVDIPLIYGMDHVHGANYLDWSTVFPHNINLGATFNDQMSTDEARILARESADLGHHWIFAPIMGIGRNPLWPRFYETYGEDPYLCGRMGVAFTKELEKASEDIAPYRQAACVKHYIGYSDPRNGWDRRPAWIPDQHLYEFYVPSFKAVIDAGVKTVMVNGGEINGIPVHASHKLLTKLLRDELKFTGVVVTDWEDVRRLYRTHKVVENMEEAVLLAIHSGIDISMTPYTTDFPKVLAKLVQDGKISMERIDLSVARILRLKYQLGLFDHPFPRNDRFERIASKEHLMKARQAARESIVLLKNEDEMLPLEKRGKRYVMAGLNADSRMGLAGGWTLRWVANSDDIFSEKINTFYQALKAVLPASEVILANADNIKTQGGKADAIILAVGESPYAEG